MKVSNRNTVLYKPSKEDASAVYELVKLSPPLEVNSLYSYLLLCSHFSDTCVIARAEGGNIVGFVSAYLIPSDSSRLFVWQVAVHPNFRRQNLAQKMIKELFNREVCSQIKSIEATVMPSNNASNNFFESLAKEFNTQLNKEVIFSADLFGKECHEEEVLLKVSPLN